MNKWQREVYDMLRAASRNYLPCTIPASLVHVPANMMLDADNGSKWISVEERLPRDGEQVYIWVSSYGEIGWVSNGKWRSEYVSEYDEGDVTYWMPLPEPPKEEQ